MKLSGTILADLFKDQLVRLLSNLRAQGLKIALGKCLFCQQCEEVRPTNVLYLTQDYELAVYAKDQSVLILERESKQPDKEE
ncbi:MAG: hypothetical protein ACLFVP_02805 [Candidatus Bathyarchaeia archaeon]